jgi:NADH-ubiquinone oxidoreductase chain 5
MYLALIILPLLGSIVSGFFGRKVGVSGAQLITCSSVITTTTFAILAFFEVGLNNIPVSIHLFKWIDSESLNISWGFNFDSLTVSMLIPVLIISSLVHVYSIGYMSHDPHNQRFFSYLSLFTFMMIILVTANNFLLMFVGWEGVGVCSYLLVSFWFTRIAANQSSLSAFLTNRVGDCFLTIGMFAILLSFGNIDYSTVFSLAPFMSEDVITLIGICLLIGAMAKSSQIGLHVWLPMAMEGPTPVSALIHAATMVTAGVYLLMRSSPLIEYSSTVLLLCLWIGAITTVFSSLIGLFQQDIKKVIAYSTMSQLAHFQSLHPNYKPSQAIACSTLLGSSPPTPPGQRWPRLLPGPFITVSHNLSPPYIFGSWPFSTSNYLSSLPQVKCCTRLPLNLKPSFTIPYISNPGTPCALPWNPLRYFSNTLRPLDLLDQ